MWYFRSPEIVFGEGALAELDQISAKRVFIVTDPGVKSLGYLQLVQERLAAAGTQSSYFDAVEPDPGIETVERCAQAMLVDCPDWIIGLGGGSSLDTAKAAWLRYERPDVSLEEVSPFEQFNLRSKARFITIPTTAGSGAEVTAGAVITNEHTKRKMELATFEFLPDLAIIDPQFSDQMPPQLTADTGIDVLAHAVEGVANSFANDFSDGLCIHAFRMVFEYLPRAYQYGNQDMEARTKMANAAAIAALGLNNSHIALAHALSHSAGIEWHLPHGRLAGLFLPYTVEFNARGGVGRYQALAQALDLPAADPIQAGTGLAQAIRTLLKMIDQPRTIEQLGIERGEFEKHLSSLCDRAEMDSALATCLRFPYRDDLQRLFEYAFDGRVVDF